MAFQRYPKTLAFRAIMMRRELPITAVGKLMMQMWDKKQMCRWCVQAAGSGGCGVSQAVRESVELRRCKKSKHPTDLYNQAYSLREM